jgi:alpha-ketoglutarate-dependent 2,4-dichlorophenoxyacetate dioxygenase
MVPDTTDARCTVTRSCQEIGPGFAGEVAGVDLSRPLKWEEVRFLQDAIDRHAVLVFHDQHLDDELQVAFSRNFGELENTMGRTPSQDDYLPQIADLSNVDARGNQLSEDAEKVRRARGNEVWHSDSSFKPIAAKYSLLSAREVPPAGGETEYSDVRAGTDTWPGWDGLTLDDLEPLICEHSIVYSRLENSGDVFSEEVKTKWPPVQQHLVRTHPATGKRVVLVGSHAFSILGWPRERARALISNLIGWCTQPRFVYRHVWRPRDLVMWDNRAVMHRGRPWDRKHRRVMHRTTVAGDGPPLTVLPGYHDTPPQPNP